MRKLQICISVLASSLLVLATACGGASNPDFGLTVNTTALTVTAGGTANAMIAVTPVSKSQGSITLLLSGLPAGVGVAPAQATVGIGSTQTFVLVASQVAAASTTTLTATGTSSAVTLSSPVTHTATLNLTVVPAAAP